MHTSHSKSTGFLIAIALFGGAESAAAHDFTVTQTLVVFKTDKTFLVDIRLHLDALALGVAPSEPAEAAVARLRAMDDAELEKRIEDLRAMIGRLVRLRFDDIKMRPQVSFPEYQTTMAATSPEPTLLGTTVRLEGRVPANATAFRIGLSRSFDITQFTIVDEGRGDVQKHLLTAGEDSPDYSLNGDSDAAAADWRDTFGRYVILGFEHIIPKGLDHILFVLGLFLLSTKLGSLLWQISAFTIAHTITLAMAMGGVVSLPAHVVEPLIALSIAYVAIENIVVKDMKPWRPVVVFAFGLLHGMGFAGVLLELGFPKGQFASSLVGFNIGVEFGQLAVIAIAFAAMGWFRKKEWYRAAIIIPQSLLIAAVGLYWTVDRIVGGF